MKVRPEHTPLTLNIIGCGNVAKTLAKSWTESKQIVVQSILNRSLSSAQTAVTYIEQGTAVSSPEQLKKTDIVLIGCSDNSIEDCARTLLQSNSLSTNSVVFHCSGLLSSDALEVLDEHCLTASAHPLLSFANPNVAQENIKGSYCGIEGVPEAVSMLEQLFTGLGFNTFRLDKDHKALYHAAAVVACNYTVTLQDIALRCLAQAGINNDVGRQLLQPLLKGTVNNLDNLPPAKALTGPIARGDTKTVEAHLKALKTLSPQLDQLYRILGLETLPLSKAQQNASEEQLSSLKEVLRGE